jgi:hypothetical protein
MACDVRLPSEELEASSSVPGLTETAVEDLDTDFIFLGRCYFNLFNGEG